MNELFGRNRETLTPREKEELWQRVRDGGPPPHRSPVAWRHLALAGAAAAVAALILLFRPHGSAPPATTTATEVAVNEEALRTAEKVATGKAVNPPIAEESPLEVAGRSGAPAREAKAIPPASPVSRSAPDGPGLPPSLAAAVRTEETPNEARASSSPGISVGGEPFPAGRLEAPAAHPVRSATPNDPSGPARTHVPAATQDGSGTASSAADRAASAPPAGALPPSADPFARQVGATAEVATTAGGERAERPSSGTDGTIRGTVTDLSGAPLAWANVMIVGTQFGAFSRDDGTYVASHLPAGTYSVRCALIGYRDKQVDAVRLEAGQTLRIDFRLEAGPPQPAPEVQVVARRDAIRTKATGSQASPGEREFKNLPDVTGKDELHIRGGRPGEMTVMSGPSDLRSIVQVPSGALSVAPMQRNGVPVIPYTGGNALPNDEPYDAMFFEHYGVNPFIPTDEDALSTFAVDVDNASYTVMRRYVELGNLPPKDAVRVEEYVNFFAQGYPRFEEPDFRIFVGGAPSPFGPGYQLLRVGIKGRVIEEHDRKAATLVFVIDTSGSMEREDRLELVKRALGILVGRLRAGDEVGIVVYGSSGRVLLDPVRIDREEYAEDRPRDREPDPGSPERRRREDEERRPVDDRFGESFFDRYGDRGPRGRILRAIESLHPDGSTNAEEGLRLGYEMARDAYRPGAINRVILCSDGVANVGRTGPESILGEVRSSADKGISLTTVGFGMGNYNDVLLEQLADRGDGNYYYVDDLSEARRVFLENLTGTLQVIGRDAKVQVEFDPKRVLRYRLLGFENRDVSDRDFRNDKVDAGEIGAGHEVTALYELKLADGVERGRIATVRFRYARPEREHLRRLADEEDEESGERRGAGGWEAIGGRGAIEIERSFEASDLHRHFDDADPEFRLDAAVAEFAEILRKSYWAKESRIGDVLPVARAAAEDLGTDEADEFVRIVRKAEGLSEKVEPGDQR